MTGTNSVLAAIPSQEQRQLQPFLERVQLGKGTVLYHIGDELRYAYFPLTGLISLLAMTQDGEMLQVAMVDHDGFVGVPIVLHEDATAYHTVVQVASEVYRVRATTLRGECRRHEGLQQVTLQFAHRHVAQIGQSALCHRFHTVIQRLCRWLLVCAECVRSDTVELTQELFAQMLGAPRTAVSRAATRLQDQALIRQRHGRIQILNHAGLAACACECYEQTQPANPSRVRGHAPTPRDTSPLRV